MITHRIRRVSGSLACLLMLFLLANIASASESRLLMFEEEFCPFCAQWKREVGVIYHKTPQGRQYPLHTIDIDSDYAEYESLTDIRYTPTFVIWQNDREVGRITGYPGEDFFWGLLDQILEKLRFDNKSG